jgi:peptidoglycan glycosyltransferase
VNAAIRRLALACALMLVALLGMGTYNQAVRAEALREDPRNARVLIDEYERERGPILVDGQPIASSVATDDQLKYLRQYADGPLWAPATGFYSFIYGATGIERTENGILAGTDDRLFVNRVFNLLTGEEARGGSVELTLDPASQQAAAEGLAGKKGAVIALDATTGAVLAMASTPSYDPNVLSSHNGEEIRAAFQQLNDDPNKPLLNRSIAETYPPGSTFKVVVAAAALSSGRYQPDTLVPGPAVLDLPETTATLPNDFSGSCGPNDQVSLTDALRISCNTAFASIGMDLGDEALKEQADKFGFDQAIQIPLNVATSVFPSDLNAPQTAQAAIGQFDVRATALQMAMVAAGVANNGSVMKPYLVEQARGPDLAVLSTAQPEALSQAVTPQVAQQLQDMMKVVVDSGTGRNAQIDGVFVGGKTGTAQTGDDRPPLAWFISFARDGDRTIATATVIEDAGTGDNVSGGRVAAPISRAVMEAALGQ